MHTAWIGRPGSMPIHVTEVPPPRSLELRDGQLYRWA